MTLTLSESTSAHERKDVDIIKHQGSPIEEVPRIAEIHVGPKLRGWHGQHRAIGRWQMRLAAKYLWMYKKQLPSSNYKLLPTK